MNKFFLYTQSLVYVLAGVNHFVHPGFYLNIMPDWMPWHLWLVNLSGVTEIGLGILLIPASTRRAAAWLLIIMLVVFLVFIHIPMTIDFARRHDPLLWVAIVRIPLQFVLIGWAAAYKK